MENKVKELFQANKGMKITIEIMPNTMHMIAQILAPTTNPMYDGLSPVTTYTSEYGAYNEGLLESLQYIWEKGGRKSEQN